MAYDAIWALAIGLNITVEKISSGEVMGCENEYGELVPLEQFDYSNDKMGCIMIKSFSQVNFTGITVSLLTLYIHIHVTIGRMFKYIILFFDILSYRAR